MWCSFVHEGVFSSSFSRITIVKDDRIGLDYPIVCEFCEPAPCVKACPTGALIKGNHGIIIVNEEKCISCGNCVKACPYGAIKLHPIKLKPLICDLCEGREPVCVSKCPTNAIRIYPIEEIDLSINEEVFDQAYAHALKRHKELMKRWGIHVK